ncbi:MAG: glycosyltransferase [Clostridiales bacterium]|nr:glycosyltransferase [Clostridiales bacterium]
MERNKFEILCVTMHQKDFSKIGEMNIHSNVTFANQADRTAFEKVDCDGFSAKMITTTTRGVGKNRNIALTYADAEICLFADDDVKYVDDVEKIVVGEFEKCRKADIIIFHLATDSEIRKQRVYPKTRKHRRFEKMPWGGFRIAFRLDSIKKANLWFTTLFGGGCVFPSGEDSMWLTDAKKAGLTFYVSNKTIGKVSFEESTWFTGVDEKFYYAKGVYYKAVHPKTFRLWAMYFAFRTSSFSGLSFKNRLKWMKRGVVGYKEMLSFEEYKEKHVRIS